ISVVIIASLVIFTYLSPDEFGVYVAVIAIQRIISFFTDFGLGAALIQKKGELTKEEAKTYFTIQTVLTFSILLIVFLTKGLISSYFKLTEDSSWLLLVLVFSIFLSSFKVIPSIQLERQIKFHKLVLPQIAESLAFNLLLIILLITNQGLVSYTWAFLISALVGIPIYYYVSPWKISLGVDKSSLRHLKYGIQFQGKNVLATLKDDFLTIFLAKVLTFNELGYIGFGQRNAFFAYRTVVDNVMKVTFSTYSRIQHDTKFLKIAIEKSLFFVSSIMCPIILGIIISAPYLIAYFPKWHNKWEPAIISLTFFSLNALISSLSAILINVLDATGKVKTTLKLMVLWTALIWILTPLLIYIYNYNGVAIASFIVTLTIFITIYLVKKVVNFHFLKSIYKPFISSLIMGIIVYFGAKIFVNNLFTLILIILIGIGVYFLIFFLWAKRQITQDIKRIFTKDQENISIVSSS
ncbi:MAG: oligosaccharide flippase family protein, partial [Actinobacteria bacterium]|nr:oligosaccharide flippase family protein [Actinomycetota bacterium]